MKPLRILVSAGPTREPIDRVRYLSNRSSGRFGFAIAAAARARGHLTTLVTGPVSLPTPADVKRVDVETALDMQQAITARFADVDVVIMAAAVADFRPRHFEDGKIKRTGQDLTLDLVPNPDILAGLGARCTHQILIGFALEVDASVDIAREKLVRKNVDVIVLNGPENLDSDSASMTFVTRAEATPIPSQPKASAAEAILDLAQRLAGERPRV